MSTYVYCRRASEGAMSLAKELGGQRLRQFDGVSFIRKGKRLALADGDLVICWGDQVPEDVTKGKTVKFLNNVKIEHMKAASNKYDAATTLINAGVPTIDVFPKEYFGHLNNQVLATLKADGYLQRKKDHIGGNDLLNPDGQFDYWVRKQEFINEYRVHSFNGKSIRAGQKVPRDGYSLDGAPGTIKVHPWVRAYDGGWKIKYDGFKSTAAMRTIAHKAIAALGLTFGAVDIAQTKDGKFIVLEVNRAPGIEGNSIRGYADVIKRWADGDTGIRDEDVPADGSAKTVGVPKRPAAPKVFGKVVAKYLEPVPGPAAPEGALPVGALAAGDGATSYIREYYTINLNA